MTNREQSEFEAWSSDVIHWARHNGVFRNESVFSQAVMTREKVEHIVNAADRIGNGEVKTDADRLEYSLAVGNAMIHLLLGCEIQGVDIQKAMWAACDRISISPKPEKSLQDLT